MDAIQFNIEEQIEKSRIDQLYQRSKTASYALLSACTIYVILLTLRFQWQQLLVWYLVFITILGIRLVVAYLYEKNLKNTKSLKYLLNLFRIGIFVTGATVGSLSIFFMDEKSVAYVVMAIIVPYGIVVAALTWLFDYYSFCLYVITILFPIVYRTIIHTDFYGSGILTGVLILFFLKFSKEYNNSYIISSRLRYENKFLLENLEEEKNKLNNRLGRILNDSTTMIFVADAESLQIIQVNKGAVENIGFSFYEFCNINLLEIFTDIDKLSFDKMLNHIYFSNQDTVIYKGINKRKDGSTFPVEARLQISSADVPPIIVANVQDITERTKWEEELIYQANFDQLTGLYNRHYIRSYMHSVFNRAKRYRNKVALLFIDLDNFKNINDTLGHDVGDDVLKQIAKLISCQLRKSDVAARNGGDEFTIILENLDNKLNAELVARKIVDVFQKPLIVKDKEIYTTVSVGISIYPDDGESYDLLMQCSDMAMYKAKADGRNNYRFFSEKMRQFSEKQMIISNYLRNALAKNELYLLYQPKIDIIKGRIVGAEALLRWHNDKLGEISPMIFIPLAENIGIINEVGRWVIENACKEAMAWQQLTDEKIHISVNVSPQQFRSGTLVDIVEAALRKSGLSVDLLELEITENLLIQDSDNPLSILNVLHERGVTLALDDFGTGYSSLSYLRKFPIHVLKIDRSFINDLENDQNNRALVDAIIAMAQSLGLEIVAEGVENQQQLDYLREREVKIIQGYFFSPPVPSNKFVSLLKV
jgi:diguanylate cyclase (GGDEF)-like protein/PAS domain S-box-containing protein